MLEHESLPGMTDTKPTGMKSNSATDNSVDQRITVETLTKKVSRNQ